MPIKRVACRIVCTVITHFRTQFAIVSSRTICKILLVEVMLVLHHNWIMYLWCKFNYCNLDHSWLLCVLAYSCTLLSRGGSGRTGHRMDMTYCNAHHKYQLCILGDIEVNIEPRLTVTLFCFMLDCRQQCSLFWQVTPQKPVRQTHAPVSFKHVSLFRQCLKHVSLQWRPHRPAGHGLLQLEPWREKGKNCILVKFRAWSKMCISSYHYQRVKSLAKILVKVRHHVWKPTV